MFDLSKFRIILTIICLFTVLLAVQDSSAQKADNSQRDLKRQKKKGKEKPVCAVKLKALVDSEFEQSSKVLFNLFQRGYGCEVKISTLKGSIDSLVKNEEYDLVILNKTRVADKFNKREYTSYNSFITESICLINALNLKTPLKNLKALASSEVKSIGILDPSRSDFGKVTVELLQEKEIWDEISKKTKLFKQTKELINAVKLKQVHFGFIPKSHALKVKDVKRNRVIEELSNSYVSHLFYITNKPNKIEGVNKFKDFSRSYLFESAFTTYGYSIAKDLT